MLTVYSKDNCPYCVQVKNLLTKRNIEFEEIRIDQDISAKEFILKEGHRTVPQIYYNGELFVEGGYNGLVKLTESQIRSRLEKTKPI